MPAQDGRNDLNVLAAGVVDTAEGLEYPGRMSLVDVYRACGLESEPAAILWDMDGTITDTESQWVAHSRDIVEARGGIWTAEDEAALHGSSTEAHAEHLSFILRRDGGDEAAPMTLFKEVADLMAEHVYSDPDIMPGAIELLDAFAEAQIPQALVTATPIHLVGPAIESLPKPYFAARVTGDEPFPGKPDPAPYAAAMRRLDVAPDRCLAFEDSIPGATSAAGAGATVVNVMKTELSVLAALL